MPTCIRCRDELTRADANYCGNCGCPIIGDESEEAVRERAREEHTGFLDGFDVKAIMDTMDGDQAPPAEPYQWYLEEAVKLAFLDLAILQRWGWFDKAAISDLFLEQAVSESDLSDEALSDFMVWGRVSGFLYNAFGPAGLELSIRMGALFADDLHPANEIDVEITVEPGNDDTP